MAFTAVHYPMDKEQNQLSYWPDNDELAVTGDNFFDQFVTFDSGDPSALGGDFLEDPPSPSLLLDSLDDSLTNSSSNDQDLHTGRSNAEGESAAKTNFLMLPSRTRAEQPNSTPAVLTALAADPILSVGSISDSELLRLEGISLKSPKGTLTAPSSPPFDNTESLSPRKHSRFVESVYATIRRATHRSKPRRSGQTNITAMDAFKGDMGPHHEFGSSDINDYTRDLLGEVKQEPIDNSGLPQSPPLTGRIPNDHHSDSMRFVSGHLDDPFGEGMLAPSTVINPAKNHNVDTPMSTPVLNGDSFYQHPMASLELNTNPHRQQQPKAQRSASSAEWPMEGLLDGNYGDDAANLWSSSSSSAAYIPDRGLMASPGWWDANTAGINGEPALSSDHNHHYSHEQTNNSNGTNKNPALNLSLHTQQQQHADLPYEFSTTTNNANTNPELSGLMIHMPQPQPPQAAVLSASLNDTLSARASSFSLAPPPPQHQSHHNGYNGHNGGHSEQRRPRPRAPSSGARHHCSLTSPRKLHHSGSRPYLREESTSPTPPHRARALSGSSGSHPQQQRSHSISVRKRRSWCRREPRTPTSSTSTSFGSLNNGAAGGGTDISGMNMSGMSMNVSRSGGGIDFVNFTPSDKNVLMTGVAPSGSSKTKARREKEALEKRRRMSEAALKAVQAAGGDIDRLVEEGFVM